MGFSKMEKTDDFTVLNTPASGGKGRGGCYKSGDDKSLLHHGCCCDNRRLTCEPQRILIDTFPTATSSFHFERTYVFDALVQSVGRERIGGTRTYVRPALGRDRLPAQTSFSWT